MLGRHAQLGGQGVDQAPGVGVVVAEAGERAGQERPVLPDRLAVGAPQQVHLPPGERLTRVPLAGAVLDQAPGAEPGLEPFGQGGGLAPLVVAVGVGGPLRGLELGGRHERGLASHREAHVARLERPVDLVAQTGDGLPHRLGVGLGRPGSLGHPGDLVRVVEAGGHDARGAGDRGRALRGGRGHQRDVALAGGQPGGGVEADPAGAGQVHLGPGVEVGEVLGRAGRAVQRLHVGRELHQVARHEPGRHPQLAQGLDQEPGRVPARAGTPLQRGEAGLDAGLVADLVVDLARQLPREVEQEAHRGRLVLQALGHRLEPGRQLARPRAVGAEVGGEVGQEVGLVDERDVLGVGLQEEVERVDRHQLGHQVHLDREVVGGLGHHDAGQVVAERVLLPVEEVVGRLHGERVRQDRGAGVGGRAEAHHLGRQLGPAGVLVRRAMA